MLNIVIDILLHESGHIMLSDFDLAKQSNEPGGRPAGVVQVENGLPMVDTRSCTANVRANSFVGTEGKKILLLVSVRDSYLI